MRNVVIKIRCLLVRAIMTLVMLIKDENDALVVMLPVYLLLLLLFMMKINDL